jgi:carbamoyltransferase
MSIKYQKMPRLLGLRLCEHDSNISYFDGYKVHYLKSERLYNIKYHAYDNLWEWKKDIKKIFGIDEKDIDEIAIIIDPWRNKLPMDNEEFYPAVEYEYIPTKNKVWRINHHLAHALSCWPLYKKRPDYEVIIDGFGDMDNAWTVIKKDKILERGYTHKNGSLGLSMSKSAVWLKIKDDYGGTDGAFDGAGKLMGLQSYGRILKDFRSLLNYNMYSIDKLFSIDNDMANKQPLDWIRTVHDKVSDILVDFFEKITNKDYNATISYSGGVAQNVIWNTAIKNKFNNLIIPPHCNDEGLSLGALEYLRIKNNLPEFKLTNFPYIQSDEKPEQVASTETIIKTAEHLKNNKIVAWYQNNGEIGPRALGNRSLLLNPLINDGKNVINKIKKREAYRPFGASVLKEYVKEYFNTEIDNPHMLYVGKTTKKNLKCITHIDGTCRFQSVDKNNQTYYSLIKEFYKRTECPLLLNTSFNINGKPIMSNFNDAKEFFQNSDIDVLVIGNKIYEK